MTESLHCRACFELIDTKAKKSSKLNEIVEKYEVTIADFLSECTGLYLNNKSILKEIICVSCKKKLIGFFKFKQQVLDTDKRFKELNEPQICKVKLEEMKMEVDVWESEIPNDDFVQSPQVQTQSCPSKRRSQAPQRRENLVKYQRNDEGLYECPREDCPGLFKNLGRLEVHLEDKHPDTDQTSFPCETCGEEFLTFLTHKRHVFKYHTPRPYICDICGNSYPFHSSLRTHISSHVKRRQVKKESTPCAVCGKVFGSEETMLRHRMHVHFPKELIPKPFICNVCGSQWASKGRLVAHMQNHAIPKFECDLCSKTFAVKFGLLQHKKFVHMDNRPYFCDICGKTYKTKRHLQNHQVAHTDERPFKCPTCPSTFKSKASLQEHETRTHTSREPFACHVCGKLCKSQRSLRGHMVQHNGQDIKCPHCDITYKEKVSLGFHIKTIHLGFKRRHACPFCMVHLSSRIQIVKHLKETHQNDLIASNKQPEELVQRYWTTDPSGANIGEKPPVVSFVKSE